MDMSWSSPAAHLAKHLLTNTLSGHNRAIPRRKKSSVAGQNKVSCTWQCQYEWVSENHQVRTITSIWLYNCYVVGYLLQWFSMVSCKLSIFITPTNGEAKAVYSVVCVYLPTGGRSHHTEPQIQCAEKKWVLDVSM